MRYRTRSVSWHGQTFRFQCLRPKDNANDPPDWAVSHGQEFIGMMPCTLEVTTKEFDMRCAQWLAELLGEAEV